VKRWDRRFCVGLQHTMKLRVGGLGFLVSCFLNVDVSAFDGKESNFMLGKSCILLCSYLGIGERRKSRPSARVGTRERHSSRL
jgi:hypothetical protein